MNNLFQYATKELSQDAFLCWSISWLKETPSHPLYQYGKAMLDLLLGDQKQEYYYDLDVKRQYGKIDVFIQFMDDAGNSHALIIEDKTNTCEHDEQMLKYKRWLQKKAARNERLDNVEDLIIHLAYVKTGIMYDEDVRMCDKGAVVVDLNDLSTVVSDFAERNDSEILSDFYTYIQIKLNERDVVEKWFEEKKYEQVLTKPYGQFCFLDRAFSGRSKGRVIGKKYVEKEENPPVFVDRIYAGTNNGGTPWTQYCFWGKKYPDNLIDPNKNEYHYLFWRIDCKWKTSVSNGVSESKPYYYIALRHYDEQAHSKNNNALNDRKKFVYGKLRKHAGAVEKKGNDIFASIGVRDNYKESDLLFIPISKLEGMHFDEIKTLLSEITASFAEPCREL